MATIIPRSPGPQVQVQDAPNVRNTTMVDASGAEAIGRGIQSIAKVGAEYAERQQARNDVTAVMQARRELSDWESQTFDPANPEGISKFKGKEALGANEALVPSLDKRVSEISGRLTPRQRAQFDQVSGNFRDQLQGRLNGYMDREHQGYVAAEQKATMDNLGQDAVGAALAGDFGRQDSIANEVLAINRARRDAEGMGEELIKAEERGIVSSIRAQTIEGMLTAKPFEAQAYYDRYADQMTPEDRAKVDRALYPVVSDAEADAKLDAIEIGRNVDGGAEVGSVVDTIIGLESGGVATAKNPESSATGAGQFLNSTWLDVLKRNRPELAKGKSDADLLALRTDGALSREMVDAYSRENASALAARGVPATAVNLYAAHHFGAGGGAAFAKASPSTPMSSILPRKDIAANQYLQGKTKAQVLANWERRGLRAGAVSEPTAGPPPQTLEDTLELIRSQERDPRMRAKLESKARDRWQIRDARTAEQERAISESIHTSIAQTTNPAAPLREIIGADAYAYAERKGNIPALENQRKAKLLGTLTQDDVVLVDSLNREAVLSPNTFMQRDLYSLAGKLSTDTLGTLLDMQKKVKDPVKRADWASENDRIDQNLRVLGLGKDGDAKGSGADKKNAPRDQQRGEFRIAYQSAVQAYTQQTGKAPTHEQADVLARKVRDQFAIRLAAGTTEAYSVGESYQKQITEADRAAIRNAYRAKYGVNPTDAWVTQYVATKRGNVQ